MLKPLERREGTITVWNQETGQAKERRRSAFAIAVVGTFLLLTSASRLAFAQQPTTTPAPPPATAPATTGPEKQPVSPDYRIGVGDSLNVEVFSMPELTRTVTVVTGGKINYPLIGELKVEGLTLTEMGRAIEHGLIKELTTPQVTVTLAARRPLSVSILGPVRTQGKFNLKDGWRILDLIAECGGLTVARPEWVRMRLQRGDQDIAIDPVALLKEGSRNENRVLQDGDLLIVTEADLAAISVQIYGAVAKPGPVPVPPDGSLMVAVAAAGGIAPRARLTDSAIRRGTKTIPVDLSGLGPNATGAQLAAVSGLRLEPGDALVIPFNGQSYSVLGAVISAGAREYPEGNNPLTPVAALLQAGGSTADADLKNAKIVRLGPDGKPVITPVNLEDAMKRGAPTTQPGATAAATKVTSSGNDVAVLKPGDVLYVPSHKPGKHQIGLGDALMVLPFVNLFR